MTRQFTYGRQERLKSRKLIEQLFREGKALSVPPFRVYWLLQPPPDSPLPTPASRLPPPDSRLLPPDSCLPTPDSRLQCGVGVSSRQFRKAVDRNRVKRLTREAWRLQKQPLAGVMAARPEQLALFFIYTGKELPAFDLVKEKMAIAIRKLAAILQETKRGNEKGPLHT